MDRLSSFVLRRLRHVQRREIRRLAVRNGLLMMTTAIVDGFVVGRYVPAFDPSHLIGELDQDRQWIRDRLAAFLIDAPKDSSGRPDLLSAAPVWPAQLRRRLPAGNGADDAALAYAVRLVAEAGEVLGIKTMATVLLLAAAIEESGVELRDLVAFLRQPAGVFAVQVSVEGFERSLPHLVEETAFVPFGPYVGMAADFTFVDELWRYVEGQAKRVFLQIPVAKSYRPSSSAMRAQLLWALAHGSPVLAVAETHQGVPDQVDLTSDVRLTGGGISVTFLADLLEAVYGSDAVSRHDGLIAVIDAGALTLDDLSIAIRPGRSILSSIEALVGLAVHNREERDNEKDKGHTASSRRLITQSPSERAAQSSQDRSAKGDNRRSKAQPTGAEVINPVPADGETPGEGRPPLLVETLTGYGAAKDWALGVKADLADYLAGDLAWSDMSTKLLLSGPPGTGKTTFARAMCNSLQIPLVVTSVSTWLQGEYLNAVLDRMANTFAEARAQAPCILFIDEIDGIGMRVSASRQHADYWNACVNKLIELLDGAVKSAGVIIVGATNRPNEIDEAIHRSGRLETHIEIPRPDIPSLAGILAHHLGADLDVVAKSDIQDGGQP
ncbi:AAA family ATPase [Rhizobium leguminosarum]|uniref:AAA family ATPase n=1 Tax=Rhizobium leguminosarum TaxID=384 RepID=UPI001C9431AD|nr:ATP-binding protein [Rhizobium leguminosarum]MBY5456410.1 AAA family ATPase [Rhizobium leguminosarum]